MTLPRLGKHLLVVAALLAVSTPMLGEDAGSSVKPPDVLWNAAQGGDLAGVNAALDAGVPVDSARRYGATALLMAAGGGHLEVVRALLEAGADENVVESFWGSSALGKAIQGQHVDVALLLLESGASFDSLTFYQGLFSGRPDIAAAMFTARPIYTFEKDDALAAVRPMGLAETVKGLEALTTVDEVPTVKLTDRDLDRYVGIFGVEGSEAPPREVKRRDGQLVVIIDGKESALRPVDERHFRTGADAETAVFFLLRAGVVDGFTWVARGFPPSSLRRLDDAGFTVQSSSPDAAAGSPRAAAERGPDRAWPSFRGPGGSGVSDGHGAPVSWDLESGAGVSFRVTVPVLGLTRPVTSGGRVYLPTAVADGEQGINTGLGGDPSSAEDAGELDWRVLAYDANHGELLWSRSLGVAKPGAQRHRKSSHANSTVAADGRRVFAVFPTAGLAALDAETGEVLWRHDLGDLSSGTADGVFEWGFASSPIRWRDLVILQVDIHGGSYLAAWDAESGEQRWRRERDEIPTWSTPSVMESGDHVELVVAGTVNRAYDPRTGADLWQLGPNSEIVVATPVVGDGVVYLTSGYPPIRPIYAVRAGHRGDLSLGPDASSSPAVAWSHSRGGGYMPSPILYRGQLYMPHPNGRLVAYDAKTGDTIFRARFSQRGTITGSPVAGDGVIYVPSEEGLLYVIEAGSKYRELAVHDMGSGILTTPALAAGRLYVRTLDELIALGEAPSGSDVGDDSESAAAAEPRHP
ncbi:MAG: PQQ-binding-like beta-propeller repeat protein [Acidobacteriota bacterium]